MQFHDEYDSECAWNFVQIPEKWGKRPLQWLDKHSKKEAWVRVQKTKKGKTREEQSQTMFIVFFDIKGNVHKGFILAGHTINSTYYCDVLW
jgi:hypothetical protein